MPQFTGHVALITGATSGIGRATARAFAREGAAVVLAGRRVVQGEQVKQDIETSGGRALFIPTDVTQEEQIRNLVQKTISTFGRLDFAVNNAGIEGIPFVPTHEQTVENYRKIFDCNVLGILLSMKQELAVMLPAGRGVIVNMSSVAGMIGTPGMGVYAASKHAVMGLTKSAALEYATAGIRINAVCPGGVETEMAQRLTQVAKNAEDFIALHPLGRLGTAEEIASAVLYLCTPGAAFATGAAFVLDGGWSAR
jgi:NAD(P)-dependent dehydrogenase (short-subunit alcohol dehydrogenase family)